MMKLLRLRLALPSREAALREGRRPGSHHRGHPGHAGEGVEQDTHFCSGRIALEARVWPTSLGFLEGAPSCG